MARLDRSLEAKTTDETLAIYDEVAFSADKITPVNRSRARKRIEQGVGQVVFLDAIRDVIHRRCKILGLYSPEKYQLGWREEARRAGLGEVAEAQFEAMIDKFTEQIIRKKSAEDGPPPPEEEATDEQRALPRMV